MPSIPATINNYRIINSESTLETKNSNLRITKNIPKKVLTGSRYDIDLIINEPLGDYIIAGNLTEVKEPFQQPTNQSLKPMNAGGLFKSVQAPLKPGKQTWAALIAHPDGLIAITKKVDIINGIEM